MTPGNQGLTSHAAKRLEQRGLRQSDIEFAAAWGTPTKDGVVFSGKDAARVVRQAKHQIERAERLAGVFFVTAGDSVVTAYRPHRKKLRRLLRDHDAIDRGRRV